MRTELIIAEKEFRDHLTSRRFLALLTVMLLLSIYGMYNGLSDYANQLNDYKDTINTIITDPQVQQSVVEYQQLISDAQAKGSSPEEIAIMQETLGQYLHPQMPGLSLIFYRFNEYFLIVGIAIAGVLGFSMITKEREEDSLKMILSKPVFRDAIINGKTIGATGIIVLILTATFLLMISLMLLYGIIPTLEDIGYLLLSFVNMALYCLVFLGISVLISTLVKNSTDSLIIYLVVVLLFYMGLQFTLPITDVIVGPPPTEKIAISEGLNDTSAGYTNVLNNPEIIDYLNKRQFVSEATNIVIPIYNYLIITNAIIANEKPYMISQRTDTSLLGRVALTLTNFIAMGVEILVTFLLSYILFIKKCEI